MEIITGKLQKAQKVVIYGPEGVGKSTFATQFPDPLFIDTEDSTITMDVARFPRPSSWTMLLSQVEHVKQNPGICKTLVVDTGDWAEKLCITHICSAKSTANNTIRGIEDFGYGKGYVYLEEEFGRMLNKLQEIIDIGINVVITAHAIIKKIEQPEEIGGYDHWQMKLEKKTMPLLKEWADIILFANYKTYVVNVDNQGATKGKNKAQGGKRVMYTTHTPWWDAKNRHGLKDELPFVFAEIAHCLPGGQAIQSPAPPTPPPAPPATKPEVLEMKQETVKPEPSKPEPPKQDRLAQEVNNGIPRALADLMATNEVTLEEIQRVVADRGYYPINTPITNYDPGFIDGVLVGAWSQVFQMILAYREDVPF